MIWGPFVIFLTSQNKGPDPLSPLVGLLEDLFRHGDDPFGPAQIHDDVAALEPLHETVGQFALLVVVLLIDIVPLGILHPLDDDLLGGLHGDPAEGAGFDLDAQAVSRFRFLIEGAPGLRQRRSAFRIQNLLHRPS